MGGIGSQRRAWDGDGTAPQIDTAGIFMTLIDHPAGDYQFLPGISPYSCGVVARPGFEIVHVALRQPPAYELGFERISEFLHSRQRPRASLCGVSLRSPVPYSFQGFADFNRQYASILRVWDVFVDGINPVARTNVAPMIDPPREPVLQGFSFTEPCRLDLPPTFVVAGAGELPEGSLSRDDIVARGDTSAEAIAVKARFVMDLMQSRLQGLGVDWPQVTRTNIYTAHSLHSFVPKLVFNRVGSTSTNGVNWHYSRPPVEEIEYEMDVRGVRTELLE